ncbi:MAG: hypothetical protein M3Y27_22750 [Acidobacteriota bacterium]|nr:hypothetical protein [Acidobacteriota bacterium]
MSLRVLFLCVVVCSRAAFAQVIGQSLPLAPPVAPEADGIYQIHYLANLSAGDSYLNFTNAGTLNGMAPAGNICINVYAFDPAEELISCCSCPITPNGLASLSAQKDLLPNTLTPGLPTSLTVKLVSSAVFGTGAAAGVNISATACNAAAVGTGLLGPPSTGNVLARGMRSWRVTLHLNTAQLGPIIAPPQSIPLAGGKVIHGQTEDDPKAELSSTELAKLTSFCAFIQANGSGFGLCGSCRFGALGATQR